MIIHILYRYIKENIRSIHNRYDINRVFVSRSIRVRHRTFIKHLITSLSLNSSKNKFKYLIQFIAELKTVQVCKLRETFLHTTNVCISPTLIQFTHYTYDSYNITNNHLYIYHCILSINNLFVHSTKSSILLIHF